MASVEDSTSGEFTLDELMARARDADPATRVPLYRDRIAAFGAAAVSKISPWLEVPHDRNFAVTVIERAGSHYGSRVDATRALTAAHSQLPNGWFRSFLEAALARLGPPPRKSASASEVVRVPRGYQVAPPYKDVHHVVVDHVLDSATIWGDVYLFACHRFFSGRWVRRHGGIRDPDDLLLCYQCRNALERQA